VSLHALLLGCCYYFYMCLQASELYAMLAAIFQLIANHPARLLRYKATDGQVRCFKNTRYHTPAVHARLQGKVCMVHSRASFS
jgi:hypothetical protein